MVSVLLPLVVLLACSEPTEQEISGLEGFWSGEVDCENTVLGVTLDLHDNGGDQYFGDTHIYRSLLSFEDGVEFRTEIDFLYTLLFELDGAGAQDLYPVDDFIGAECTYFEDGTLISDSCEELGYNFDDFENTDDDDFGVFSWDGKNEMSMYSV